MAQSKKSNSSHLGTLPGSVLSGGIVKKRGHGYRYPSNARHIVESVHQFLSMKDFIKELYFVTKLSSELQRLVKSIRPQ